MQGKDKLTQKIIGILINVRMLKNHSGIAIKADKAHVNVES
jgi:hypothetical protein